MRQDKAPLLEKIKQTLNFKGVIVDIDVKTQSPKFVHSISEKFVIVPSLVFNLLEEKDIERFCQEIVMGLSSLPLMAWHTNTVINEFGTKFGHNDVGLMLDRMEEKPDVLTFGKKYRIIEAMQDERVKIINDRGFVSVHSSDTFDIIN